ncbi:MAG: hypothetical protein R2769_00110 [Saprospiraceae bacterium]
MKVEAEGKDIRKYDKPCAGRKKKKKSKSEEAVEENQPYINIELIGGGYYGGIDPVLKDFIHVKSDGRLIKEFKKSTSRPNRKSERFNKRRSFEVCRMGQF